MSCNHAEDVCQDCLEKVETEDVCQDCLEKVETEEAPRKTIAEKRNLILINSALLGLVGYISFYNAKSFLNNFDFGLTIVQDILETLLN